MGFDPRSAIVTGASQGIGRATAHALARKGIAVALAARHAGNLAAVEREIRGFGGSALAIPTDVADEAGVATLVETSARGLGPIDLLVNNAGTVERAEIVEMEADSWDRVIAVNLRSAFLCTRAVLRQMIPRGRGRIVNVSSISGTLGTPKLSAYCASKWGLLGFAKSAAEELRDHGVQVFSVCPGSVRTPMLEKGLPGAAARMEPGDIASVVVYLATDAPDAMTGASLDVFG